MKNWILLFLLTGVISIPVMSQSQLYKPFEVDAGLVFAFPTNDELKLGAGIYIEPKYNIADQFAMGFKIESVAIATDAVVEINGDLVDVNVSSITSLLVTGDYYLNTELARPFVGLGAGVYIASDIDYSFDQIRSHHIGTRFGFAPRAGVVVGHFRLALEYNVIPGLDGFESRDYFGLKVGFEIGGGKIASQE